MQQSPFEKLTVQLFQKFLSC